MRSSMGWGRGLLFLALPVAVLTLILGPSARADRLVLLAQGPPGGVVVTPRRVCTGEVALAGGWNGGMAELASGVPASQSLVGLFKLDLAPRACHGLKLEVRIRHPFYDDSASHYWRSERECVIEGTAPLARSKLRGFVTWTRAYSGRTNGYCLAGIRRGF